MVRVREVRHHALAIGAFRGAFVTLRPNAFDAQLLAGGDGRTLGGLWMGAAVRVDGDFATRFATLRRALRRALRRTLRTEHAAHLQTLATSSGPVRGRLLALAAIARLLDAGDRTMAWDPRLAEVVAVARAATSGLIGDDEPALRTVDSRPLAFATHVREQVHSAVDETARVAMNTVGYDAPVVVAAHVALLRMAPVLSEVVDHGRNMIARTMDPAAQAPYRRLIARCQAATAILVAVTD